MSAIVERVARAIAAEVGRQDGDEPLDADWIADGIFKWNLVAQAAIDASGLADTITRLQAALASVSRKYAAAVSALEFAHSEGFEWPMDPFGPEAMAFADPTIVPEYEVLSVGGE